MKKKNVPNMKIVPVALQVIQCIFKFRKLNLNIYNHMIQK